MCDKPINLWDIAAKKDDHGIGKVSRNKKNE
jgi:hypothetical protein